MQEESCKRLFFYSLYIAGNRAATIEHLANVLQLADLPSRKSAQSGFSVDMRFRLSLTIVDIEDRSTSPKEGRTNRPVRLKSEGYLSRALYQRIGADGRE